MTETLKPNEEVNPIHVAKLHWVIFFWPVVFLLVSMALGGYFELVRQPSYLLSAFALLWILFTWVTYYFSSLTIQPRHVILRTGILVRETKDIPLNKIESMDIRQSLLGSIFQYGTLIITGTGGTHQSINYLEKPLTCRRYIEQLLNDQSK